MLKFDEDLGKVEDVTKQMEFESSIIRNISDKKNSLKYLMKLIKIFKCTFYIKIMHQLRGLI